MSKLVINIKSVTEKVRQEMAEYDKKWTYTDQVYCVEVVGGLLDGEGWFCAKQQTIGQIVDAIRKRELVKKYGRRAETISGESC